MILCRAGEIISYNERKLRYLRVLLSLIVKNGLLSGSRALIFIILLMTFCYKAVTGWYTVGVNCSFYSAFPSSAYLLL